MSDTPKSNKVYAHNLTLITSGFRSRVRGDTPNERAALDIHGRGSGGEDAPLVTDQHSLHKLWEERLSNVDEESYAYGAGEPGIFSAAFAQQVEQLADLDNTWMLSTGLGMVCASSRYPQYDLREHETDITTVLPKGAINAREWWAFLCRLNGKSASEVILSAISSGHRVVVALPALQLSILRDDLSMLVDEVATGVPLKSVYEHVRFIGADLDAIVLPKLIPCVMPYNREALDRLVPGARSHATRRMAALLEHVSPVTKTGRSNPRTDFDKLVSAFNDMNAQPIMFETNAQEAARKTVRVSDDELRDRVRKCLAVTGPEPARVARMIKADGISLTTERVSEMIEEVGREEAQPAAKSTAKRKAAPKKSKSKPSSKRGSSSTGKTASKRH